MQVRVVPFGVLKDWLGTAPATIELREGASVADLLQQLDAPADALRGIAVSVNTEYATAAQVLCEGDEVGLLPPVSGGTSHPAKVLNKSRGEPIVIALTRNPIDAEELIASAKSGEDGAVVVFDGIVRNNTRSRETLYLDYEAYEEMAVSQMKDLAAQARERFSVRQVTIVHRLGRLYIGETSVLIVVASTHRAQAFDACRWLIDMLKRTVPIWKKETFVDGTVWAAGEPFPIGVAVNSGGGQ
jgi:molybdopterin synthase catalytic subunit/molybdopterin converting factor small subunit